VCMCLCIHLLRGEALTHKKCLRQIVKIKRTCICVLRVSILSLHMIFQVDFGIFHLRILLRFVLLDL
jgi:hypothetical protein